MSKSGTKMKIPKMPVAKAETTTTVRDTLRRLITKTMIKARATLRYNASGDTDIIRGRAKQSLIEVKVN